MTGPENKPWPLGIIIRLLATVALVWLIVSADSRPAAMTAAVVLTAAVFGLTAIHDLRRL